MVRRVRGLHFLVAVSGLLILTAFCNPAWSEAGSGAATFKSKCVLCHGADGSGKTPLGKQLQAADLRSKDVQKRTNAELRKAVHDGQANMPAFADQLSDDEIDQVVRYVRTLDKVAKK